MLLPVLLALQQEWVVKDVLPPQSQAMGSELAPQWGGVCGDLDGDFCSDGYLTATDYPWVADYLRLQWGPAARRSVTWDAWPASMILGGGTVPRTALLNSPMGRLVVAGEFFYNASLTSRLVRDPAVPVMISPSVMPLAFTRADDMNGDGWEEIFYQDYDSVNGYTGLMDGRTLTRIWENFHAGYTYPSMLSRNESGPLPDMDGDLIPDFVAGWSIYTPSTGQWENSIMAISGADGSVLWENRDGRSTGVFIYPVTGYDLTGDGVQDIVVANGSVIKGVSGADGQTLWFFDPYATLQSAAPSGWNFLDVVNPCVLTVCPTGGSLQMIFAVRYLKYQGFSTFRLDLAHLDPYSGVFLGLAALPDNLDPWFSDAFQVSTPDAHAFALGDQDRDCMQELAFLADAPSYDLFANGGTVKHVVTIGMKTLDVMAQASIGSVLIGDVSIPSASGHDFVWIASRGFDRRYGAVLDGWVTNLAPGALLAGTWTSRAFSGILDAAGSGQVQIPIPADPNLIGTRLYSRAVVIAPGGQEIWTLSTLGITEIIP